MARNIGAIDRIIRVVLGLGIVYWGVQNGSWLGLFGVILLATATIQFCLIYRIFGIRTCPVDVKRKRPSA